MTRWAEIAAQHDLVELRSFLGGQVVVGYPPAVGSVDVSLTGGTILTGSNLIGRVSPVGAKPSTFAVDWIHEGEFFELPCNRRLILGAWLIDLDVPGRLEDLPLDPIRGVISGPNGAVYVWGLYEVVRFDRGGLQWTSQGLFGGDLASVALQAGRLVCRGCLDWIEPGRLFTLLLDPGTGLIAGGDPEALAAHQPAGDLPA